MVVDCGPAADWVKINVRRTVRDKKYCFQLFIHNVSLGIFLYLCLLLMSFLNCFVFMSCRETVLKYMHWFQAFFVKR